MTTADLIAAECNALRDMLIEKNVAYGDSALNPLRIFSKSGPVEQIAVRMDDKLSRLARGNGTGNEDAVLDLLGYLILWRVAKAKDTDIAPQDNCPTCAKVAATINQRWANPHITVSFMPIGTRIGPNKCDFVPQLTVVTCAFDAWAAVTPLTFRFVPDDGLPYGFPGVAQGSPRFGDIRVGGFPWPVGMSLAQTIGPSPNTTRGGDIILNTSSPFNYLVLLHEIGHALGLGHSANKEDIMYPTIGHAKGLSAGDIAAIQQLYGASKP
jgi:hypothetical protein